MKYSVAVVSTTSHASVLRPSRPVLRRLSSHSTSLSSTLTLGWFQAKLDLTLLPNPPVLLHFSSVSRAIAACMYTTVQVSIRRTRKAALEVYTEFSTVSSPSAIGARARHSHPPAQDDRMQWRLVLCDAVHNGPTCATDVAYSAAPFTSSTARYVRRLVHMVVLTDTTARAALYVPRGGILLYVGQRTGLPRRAARCARHGETCAHAHTYDHPSATPTTQVSQRGHEDHHAPRPQLRHRRLQIATHVASIVGSAIYPTPVPPPLVPPFMRP